MHIGGFGNRIYDKYWNRVSYEFGIDPGTGKLINEYDQNKMISSDKNNSINNTEDEPNYFLINKYFYE